MKITTQQKNMIKIILLLTEKQNSVYDKYCDIFSDTVLTEISTNFEEIILGDILRIKKITVKFLDEEREIYPFEDYISNLLCDIRNGNDKDKFIEIIERIDFAK